MPVAWRGTLVQYSGRLHRRHHGKTDVRIFDNVDREVPMLDRMFGKRMKGYQAMGYEIEHVASESDDAREAVVEVDEDALRFFDAEPF